MRVLLLLTVLCTLTAEEPSKGELLYRGRAPLKARMAGSEDDLAPIAARCSNCHGPAGRGLAEAGVKAVDVRGATLTKLEPRRGGPPVAYTLESFRTALRAGHDPAGVILARAMPRYEISDSDSAALWQFLLALNEPAARPK